MEGHSSVLVSHPEGNSLSKEKITEILDRRHKKRQHDLDTIQEQKNKDASEAEGSDYFDQIFDTKTREIKNNLNNLQEGDKAELALSFNQIIQTIQELQRYLSSSTLFLTDYKIKMCQNVINELHLKCDGQKQKLIPKKKFGFKNKKAASAIPVVAVETSASTTPGNDLSSSSRVKKAFEWTLANKSREWIELTDPQEVNDKDLTFSNLEHCVIQIHGHAGSLQMSHVKNCIIVSGPIARSVFVDHCEDCHFAFACQQLRMHSSSRCDIYLHVTCRGIIEDCKEMQFATYNYAYSQLAEDFSHTSLDRLVNHWTDIADFNWLSSDVHSPNWSELETERQIENWSERMQAFRKEYGLIDRKSS